MALTVSYVGSEGHFLQLDSNNARGLWSNQLDPKYLPPLERRWSPRSEKKTGACASNNLTCPANFSASQALSTALKPFPFQTVTDSFGYVGNSNYHALQALLNMRTWHGLTVNANYTWFRAPSMTAEPSAPAMPFPPVRWLIILRLRFAADRIERTVSTFNQPQHFVADFQFGHGLSGKTILVENAVERAIMGGFSFSGIFQELLRVSPGAHGVFRQTNPAESNFKPILNPNFTSRLCAPERQVGKGITWP